jgi:eukaryotic-like serine/threonine-protein kinase
MASPNPTSDSVAPTVALNAPSPPSGSTLGEFVLLRLLGKGGMAEVWLAEQTSLKRNVALKLLKPELMSEPAYVKRFQSEAKAAGGLSHPNIVQVYSIGEMDGRHFIATEYVQGSTLKSFLQKKGALDPQTALHIMRQVASALQAASERGIVHRDIKPENIMLTKKGEVKVADFGLAQLMGGERLNLTQEGTTMGTPLYMSPEQVNGEKLDQRSDIYSFGVTSYHMLAGDTPFRGESAIAVAMQHLQAPPPDLADRRPDVPPALVQMIHRMLEKSPDDRYPNAKIVLNDLKKIMRAQKEAGDADSIELSVFESPETAPSLPVRRPWLVLSILGLLAGGASAGIGWMQHPVPPQSVGKQIIPQQKTAEEQFQYALIHNSEDAFKAVKTNFPGSAPELKLWHAFADSQLMLMYLREVQNPARKRTIEQQIEVLARHGNGQNQFALEAAIARAYLQLHSNQVEAARSTLSNLPPAQDLVQGSWARYLWEVREALQRPPGGGGGFGSGPPGGGPRSESRQFGSQGGQPGGRRGNDRGDNDNQDGDNRDGNRRDSD